MISAPPLRPKKINIKVLTLATRGVRYAEWPQEVQMGRIDRWTLRAGFGTRDKDAVPIGVYVIVALVASGPMYWILKGLWLHGWLQ